jgi:hypothetical protein
MVKHMEVHFTNRELQAKVEQWVQDTGRPAEELLEDAVAGYFNELGQVRDTLDQRYNDIKSGKVKLIPGDVVEAELRRRIEERRSQR